MHINEKSAKNILWKSANLLIWCEHSYADWFYTYFYIFEATQPPPPHTHTRGPLPTLVVECTFLVLGFDEKNTLSLFRWPWMVARWIWILPWCWWNWPLVLRYPLCILTTSIFHMEKVKRIDIQGWHRDLETWKKFQKRFWFFFQVIPGHFFQKNL